MPPTGVSANSGLICSAGLQTPGPCSSGQPCQDRYFSRGCGQDIQACKRMELGMIPSTIL